MATTENKCSLNNMLNAVLSVANTEQNQCWPPFIYESQYNVATSYLISSLVKIYPSNTSVVEMLEPFTKFARIKVKDGGYFELPEDFRNILGVPSINVKPDGSGCCNQSPLIVDTEAEFKKSQMEAGCRTRPVKIVPVSEWDYLTTSEVDRPTLEDPICMYMGSRKMRVCPYDISSVELRYVRMEKKYVFTYIMQPDDTYIFDPNNKQLVESEWNNAAFEPLFKILSHLYSAYTRDKQMSDWATLLTERNIL